MAGLLAGRVALVTGEHIFSRISLFDRNYLTNKIDTLSLAPTRRFFPASGLCLSLPNIPCVGLRQVKQRNELSHLAFLMRSIASLLLKHKHVYALL